MHLHQIDHSTTRFLMTEIFRNGTWYRISWEQGTFDKQWTMKIWELSNDKHKPNILRLNKFTVDPYGRTSTDYIEQICY